MSLPQSQPAPLAVHIQRANPLDMPTVIWRVFSPRSHVIRHRRVSGMHDLAEVTIRSRDERPIALQVDGDHVDDVLEARYTLRPKHLTVVS